MKHLFIFIFAASIASCKGPSSSIDMADEKEVRNALVGKWESTHFETSASRMEVPKELVSVVTYEANGTYDARKKGGVVANAGKWSYDPKTRQIKNSFEGVGYSQRIISLTAKEMVLADYTFINDKIVDSNIATYKRM